MGRSYQQLSLDDRCEIARLSANGSSIRQVAAALDRSPSTISRELKRNKGVQVGYKPTYANQQARARRWTGVRLEREPGLRRAVLERLGQGWSPEQVAGRLNLEQGCKVISYETIYRFIYVQMARTKNGNWRRYLPRKKSKRGYRSRKGCSPASFIEGRVSLAKRPGEVRDRKVPGHWEADLMMFSKYGQAVLTVHERTSRLLLGVRLASKVARGVARHLVRLFTVLPESLRQTVTFDNGTEFACHLALHSLSMKTYFCDPHAPWQKGGIENAIGRMRRFIPRKTDLATLPTRRFRQSISAYNNTPRKCLDFSTPAEAFAQVLHFECESTSRRTPGRREGFLKPRRPLLRERLDPFLDLGAAHAVAGTAVGGLLVELAAGEFVDGALHAAHRDRGVAGESSRELVDRLIERFLVHHHRGEIADPQHFRRVDFLRGQKQLLGVVDAEPRGVAHDAALVIMQAQPRRRHEHLAGVEADAEIAGQRQIGRAAIDAAIEPADRGNAEILEPVDDNLERRSGAVLFNGAGGALGDRIEVVSRAEDAAGAGEDQHPDRGIGLNAVEQFQQGVEVVGLQPVQMPGTVEADGGARAVEFEDRRRGRLGGVGHGCLHY
jgi:transposase, IS30 family